MVMDIARSTFEFESEAAGSVHIKFSASKCGGDYIGPESCVTCDLWFGYAKPPSWLKKAERVSLLFRTGPVCTNHSICQACNTQWSKRNNVGMIFGIKETQNNILHGCKGISKDGVSSIVCRDCTKRMKDSLQTKMIMRLSVGGIRVLRSLIGDLSALGG
jgi:hypothetical protein